MKLLNKQIDFYKKNGHLKIKNVFSKKSLRMLINFVDEIEKFKPQKNKYMIYFDKVGGIMSKTRTENFLKYHKKFDVFLKNNKVHKIVDQVLGKKSISTLMSVSPLYQGIGRCELLLGYALLLG